MKPTIGRIVHFAEENGPYAAIIVGLHVDESIDLATFGSRSLYFQHRVRYDETGAKGTWRWPPRES